MSKVTLSNHFGGNCSGITTASTRLRPFFTQYYQRRCLILVLGGNATEWKSLLPAGACRNSCAHGFNMEFRTETATHSRFAHRCVPTRKDGKCPESRPWFRCDAGD